MHKRLGDLRRRARPGLRLVAPPREEADIATTRLAQGAGIPGGRRDLKAFSPQVLALPRAAGVHLNGGKEG